MVVMRALLSTTTALRAPRSDHASHRKASKATMKRMDDDINDVARKELSIFRLTRGREEGASYFGV